MSFFSSLTNDENVLQWEIKDWAFDFYLLTGEPSQFMISADTESLSMAFARSYVWFLNSWIFGQTERVGIVFGRLSPCPDSVK